MTDKKKFGLVMPKKSNALKIEKHSVFNDDSDDDERVQKRPKIPQKKMESKNKLKTDSVEDPSIYEYDDIYEDIKSKQMENINPKEKKNSRYIETLLKAAEKRKKEHERRMDKKIQAEREKEGEKFKDKEAFVTSSYKKRMLEQEEEEEKERRENMLNDMMDVTKQKDLSGFYRHFLKQTVGEEKVPKFGERQIKEEILSCEESPDSHRNFADDENIDQDSDIVEADDDEKSIRDGNSHAENEGESRSQSPDNQQRTFQFQKHIRTHCRKSKKRPSLNSSSDENEEDNFHAEENIRSSKKYSKTHSTHLHNSPSSLDGNDDLSKKTDTKENNKNKKCDIFVKRTTGDTFANAQARYFQRMASQKTEM